MDPYLQSPGSSAQFLAFRRLVYSFSQQLSKEERQAIVYIRLYSSREKYRDATTLEVLSKLETDCVFTPNKPEGLIEIAKDVKRQDLVNEVKDFIKRRRALKDEKKVSKINREATQTATLSDEDLHLRNILEVTLSQATVLMQQVDLLQRVMVAGQVQRKRVEEVVQEASQTAERLAETLHRAQTELDPTRPQQPYESSSDDSPAVTPQDHPYCNVAMGILPGTVTVPVEAQDLPDVKRNSTPPVPVPRRSIHATTQVPVQETGVFAKTLANTLMSSEQHLQGSSPGNVYPKPRRWTRPREDKTQSAPCTPSLDKKCSAQQSVTKKPAVPPRRRTSFQSSPLDNRLVAAAQTVRSSYPNQPAEDYVSLTPEPNDDHTSSTGDSGIGDIQEWRIRKVSEPESEGHYYKSLHRSDYLEDLYQDLERRRR